MTAQLIVIYQHQIAGVLTKLKNGALHVKYEDTYRLHPEATPLSTNISLSESDHQNQSVTNWLWGLLPDSEPVLRRWGKEFSVSISSPFGLLSTPIGEDCPGAFTFVRPERVEAVLKRKREVQWLSENEVAKILRELRDDATTWLGSDLTGRFSLAGAQAKTALLWDGTQWGRPSGAIATSHILKPAIKGLDDHDLNEHLCLQAAKSVGMTVAATSIQTFEDQSALVIRRYDRIKSNQLQVRIHQEDLCQAFGVHPSKKYQNEGGPSPKSIAARLRLLIPGMVAADSIERFTDALIWNWIIAGPDAHAKNYSLLLAGQDVRLAPLYDIASALPYKNFDQKKIQLAMKFGKDYSLDAHTSTWLALARDLDIPEDLVRSRAETLVAAAPDAFSKIANQEEIQQLSSTLPARLTDAVADRAVKCATALTRTKPGTS